MEPKCERCHKDEEDNHKLQKGVNDIIEDDDVLAKDGHLPHVH